MLIINEEIIELTLIAGLKPKRITEAQVNNLTAKQEEGNNMMQSFIVEHYLNKDVDVYCGGPDIFRGKVEACADNVLTLNNEGRYTHISIDKIIALWPQ